MMNTPKTKALNPRQILNGRRVQRITGRTLKIGTWNVKNLFQAGKLKNLALKMNRLKINILGISEIRWPGNGKVTTDNGTLYLSGSDDQQNHPYGVGILVNSNTNKSIINFVPLSEKVMMMQLQTTKVRMNILQVYRLQARVL